MAPLALEMNARVSLLPVIAFVIFHHPPGTIWGTALLLGVLAAGIGLIGCSFISGHEALGKEHSPGSVWAALGSSWMAGTIITNFNNKSRKDHHYANILY